jgi:hypothetical protein
MRMMSGMHRGEATDWQCPGFDREVVDRVWQHAEIVAGNDPELWRKDELGAWLYRLDYATRTTFGWEIFDASLGRGDGGVAALRPLQWQNYLDQMAAETQSRVTADGLRNVRRLF